jgi:hypothetical protein
MMKRWLDTYAKGSTRASSVALSVAAHAMLIGAAVVATADAGTNEQELPENEVVHFLAPPNRSAGQRPQLEMIRYVALAIPPRGTGVLQHIPDRVEPKKPEKISGSDARDAPPLPALRGEDSVYSVVEVDSAATRYEWSAAPAYPPKLLQLNTEGTVRAEFIVLQDGYADTTSLRIVDSTHPDFTKAVHDALPFMRFRAAKIGGRSVNQLVQQDYQFRITTVAADSTKPRKPIP